MRCAWQAYLNLIPVWMREDVDKQGKDTLLELRLRLGIPPELVIRTGNILLNRPTSREDIQFCVNIASKYSPWASATMKKGYITATGGHRIGICGEAIVANGCITGIRDITSLNLRVARDFPGIAAKANSYNGSILIVGRPGSGKTTLLRDLIRQRSDSSACCVAVVDEREEIFPRTGNAMCFPTGKHTDVLSGCPKVDGIEAVLRNMNPDVIAVDEITAEEDCLALLHSGWCGVKLIATAHAGNREDLFNRPIYRPILENKLFDILLILHPDKSWHVERISL